MDFRVTHGLSGAGNSFSESFTKSSSAALVVDESVAGGSTDFSIPGVEIDVSAVKALAMLSDRDMTIETNSGSAADDTIALKAGVPLVWTDDYAAALPNPLTVDVTGLFATLAAGAAARFRLWALFDATP